MTHDPLEISGQKRLLFNALAERDEQLAQIYHGALAVHGDASNPDRLALAAHGLRELMEKLPRILNVPVKIQRTSLKVKCRLLLGVWDQAVERSICRIDDGWRGNIDRHLQALLDEVQKFFQWFKQDHPTRNEQTGRMIRALEDTPGALPDNVQALRVAKWRETEDYLVKVSHHGASGSEEEFCTHVDELERFLLDCLSPRTFEDFDLIDKVIKEGERSAND